MKQPAMFLDPLDAAASRAAAAETDFRREAAARIKALERDRSFAFRRLNLMRTIAEAIGRAESEEVAVASGLAMVRARLGWTSDSETRSAILSRFARVSQAAYASLHPEAQQPARDVLTALAEFEAWYAETHGASFWSLLEQPMPETPLVDF